MIGIVSSRAARGLLVTDLADIIKSKRAAGRPRDRAVLQVLEKTVNEKKEVNAKDKT